MRSRGLSNRFTSAKLELGKVSGTLKYTVSASFMKNNTTLSDEGSNTVTKDEKAEVLNAFFALVFGSGVSCSPSSQTPELADSGGEQNEASVIQREMVGDLLQHLGVHKSMGPDGIHLRVLREVLIRPLSIFYQQSWQPRQVQLTGV